MEGDEAKARAERLRDYLLEPMGRQRIRSYAELARRAKLRPNTLTDWWAQGKVPSDAALLRIAGVLDIDVGHLWRAYQGRPDAVPEGELVTISRAELEAMLRRAGEAAARLVLAETEPGEPDHDA